ncbi:L-histidine N(alpha)-methyltransferase [Streptomyces sp. P38-E01]|uniref:L-histidine N(Alpha)-methyltransferase n=1 Tax=Streptomyces tardus TaxID=2780544 RepID=A0A949JEQ5_9ACTN|nr:L-histidine N(alpha)-methyltransferase [Streptomyces tardus]MBU7598092.1 L-histidine N(alpha)-methyltransferase [Streptomyces tardus]
MNASNTAQPRFSLSHRLPPGHLADALRADALKGLTSVPKTLPPKWFYDARGSELFERITELPEYYPTRAEQRLLQRCAGEVAQLAPHTATLVELGSGSSRKTRLLLDALLAHGALARYAPLDVSPDALAEAGQALCRDYPSLEVSAVVTDYEADLTPPGSGPYLVAFLGGTLGNLDVAERRAFCASLRRLLTPGRDALLLGVDLVKDPDVLVRAYDDSRGVTAEFNKNVLHVLNRELGADFDPDAFDHRARWNAERSRVEMWLRSRVAQRVVLTDPPLRAEFERGEGMRTEISVKFSREGLTGELAAAGFEVRQWWQGDGFGLLLADPF